MTEQPHAAGRATRESSDEPSMEWLGELKSDADDPELQPVDPSVTQAFEAMLEEAESADRRPSAPAAPASPAGPAGPSGATQTGPLPSAPRPARAPAGAAARAA